MSGARTVEEILARGGAELFNIAMFGDEPFGNYNRIMLSAVLDGSHAATEIFLNPLAWYEQNAIRLHSGIRATRIFRFARRVLGADGSEEPYDNLIIATGSRSFVPPLLGLTQGDGSTKRWHLRVSLARRLPPHGRLRDREKARGGNRRRSARA